MRKHRLTERVIGTEEQLRSLLGEPKDIVRRKLTDRVTEAMRPFIERSPMVFVGTAGADGSADVSPRGDSAGFVRILDERTLLLPERPGNRLADTLRNLLACPHVGLLFVIPGIGETLRVNGEATITDDPDLLRDSTVQGKLPKLGVLIDVKEAFVHCSKAFLRSGLWEQEGQLSRDELPSSGQVMASILGSDFDAKTYDEERAARYARREGLY